ncbi:MAG: glutathione S-transferase [Rhodospirillales bacterium]
MEIYADPITVNCRKVLAGLAFMGIDYRLEKVDYFAGQHREAPYLALNPNASLPAMKDGDLVLWESNAILQYLADKHAKPDAYPTDLAVRADVNRWLFWESAQWFPTCYVYLVENCVKPLLGAEADPAILEAEAENFHLRAGILNDRLSQNAYLCGAQPTIADISIASAMHLHGWAQLPLAEHPALTAWMTQRIEALPAWQQTHVGEGFTLPDTADATS